MLVTALAVILLWSAIVNKDPRKLIGGVLRPPS
jgi:hypothetical protein